MNENNTYKIFVDSLNKNFVVNYDKDVLNKNDYVVLNIDSKLYIGIVKVKFNETLDIDNEYTIERKAGKEDLKHYNDNKKDSLSVLQKAKKCAESLNLEMNFINAFFSLDKSELIITYTADERVDFRELAKKLATIYKTRIELRQIGVRDKAKYVGGLGPCGRFLCCNSFLNEFESVSINMAKNQYISLKPDKINGICGRLLCCLNYEDEQYTEIKKDFPLNGTIFEYNKEKYKIIGFNLFKKEIIAEKKDKTQIIITLEEYESIK